MTQAIAKILMAIVGRMITEKFLSKIIVYGLNQVASSTENKLDDKMVAAVAEALGVQA